VGIGAKKKPANYGGLAGRWWNKSGTKSISIRTGERIHRLSNAAKFAVQMLFNRQSPFTPDSDSVSLGSNPSSPAL
jgi:hypothetical protein